MRIIDSENDKSIANVLLLLTEKEANQLVASIQMLIQFAGKEAHEHVFDDDYKREITIALYKEGYYDQFNSKTRKILSGG